MTTLLQHTKAELRRAGLFDVDSDYNGDIGVQVLALMETFVAYGHSGDSAERTLAAFIKLANHKPIMPLTGEEDEWEDRTASNSGSPLWQNKRCPAVFKNSDGAWLQLENNLRMNLSFPCSP